jgi:hypothetical protein
MNGIGNPRMVPLPMKASCVVVIAGPPVITVDEFRFQELLLRPGEIQIRSEEERIDQEGRDVIDEFRKPEARHQRLAHDLVSLEVFHDDDRHLVVEVVHHGDESGRQFVVLEQRLGLVAHALARQRPRIAGHTQEGQRLLEDYRLCRVGRVLDDEHQVQVAVAHLADGETAEIREHAGQRGASGDVIDDGGLVQGSIRHRS